MPVGRGIKPSEVTKDVWPVICCEPGNNDVIQLFFCILSIMGSLKKLDNRCNIPKKSFIAPGVIQQIEIIAIVYTPSLFNLLKAISVAFDVSLYGLNIEC